LAFANTERLKSEALIETKFVSKLNRGKEVANKTGFEDCRFKVRRTEVRLSVKKKIRFLQLSMAIK
jgi:hypothetical protein